MTTDTTSGESQEMSLVEWLPGHPAEMFSVWVAVSKPDALHFMGLCTGSGRAVSSDNLKEGQWNKRVIHASIQHSRKYKHAVGGP